MSADVRGFNYALEPLRKRQMWQLEALQAKLAIANRNFATAVGRISERHESLREQHARAAAAIEQRIDPSLQRRNLYWLSHLRADIKAAQTQLDELRAKRGQILRDCVTSQNKLAAIDEHRRECLAAYAQADENRLSAAADGDWLARRHRVALGEPQRSDIAGGGR
jgi:hypothetical protein